MNKVLLSIALVFGFVSVKAQQEFKKITKNNLGQEVITLSPSHFEISKPARDLPKASEDQDDFEMHDRKRVPNFVGRERAIDVSTIEQNEDPIQQKNMGTRAATEPLENWQGVTGSGYPPDPSGAAGTEFYVQAVNTKYRVYEKDGSPEQAPVNLSALWSGSTNDGDPIVMYDKHADRWFISQFQSSGNQLLIAVSVTNDPTEEFYTYEYNLSSFPDYPKYSIWSDGYYVSMNAGGINCGVFNRTKMLAGDSSAEMIIINAPGVVSNGFRSMMPASADGDLPPLGSPAYFFNLEDNYWGGAQTDGVQVYKMNTDFNNTSNTSISQDNFIETSSFNTQFGSGGFSWEHIEQPNTSQKLDAVNGVIMYRAPHRVWAGYNSIVMNHVVDVDGNDRAGIRWYEMRQDNFDSQWYLYQEGTFAPDTDETSRWMGSIAMDAEGNIGLAYCMSGPNTFPSIGYTGRYANDELGQMTIEEVVAVEGEGFQNGTDRFGDYSHMSLDPNGYTFWHTGEYIAASGGTRTRIFSFEISNANSVENPFYANLDTQVLNQGENIIVNTQGIYGNDDLLFDVYDTQGRLILHRDINPNNGSFSESFGTASMSSGNYLIRFGNINFQKVIKINIAQ